MEPSRLCGIWARLLGVVLIAEIELKLWELTVVDYDCRNWSWFLDPNRTPVPPVLSKA